MKAIADGSSLIKDNTRWHLGAGGRLQASYDYPDARAVALDLLPLEAGHYTIVAIINADVTPSETTSLTALHEWAAEQLKSDHDLLSGIAEADVPGNGIIRVIIPLQQDSFSLPVLSLRFTLPETGMPDFTPQQTSTRAAAAGYTLRSVAELYKAGTDQIVLHKAVTPELQADGTYKVDLQLSEGSYDLRLWADYARTDAPELPATTLAAWCYSYMFSGCTKLSVVKILATTKVGENNSLTDWLKDAGTQASSRTLTLANSEAYGAIESYLPDNWKSGQATIQYAN